MDGTPPPHSTQPQSAVASSNPASDSAPYSRRRRWSLRLLLLGISVVGCLLLAECSLILFEPHLPGTGIYAYDPDLGFRVRPGAADSNRFGFRDADYPLEKPADTVRILILGDSFNWAAAGDNYIDQCRAMVHTAFPNHRIDIINVGYPMTHTGEQLALLRRDGLRYQPDLVVLSFFAGNDFADAKRYRKRVVLNDCFYDVDRRSEWQLFGLPMVPRSRLWTLIKQKWTVIGSTETIGSTHRRAAPAPAPAQPGQDRNAAQQQTPNGATARRLATLSREQVTMLARTCAPDEDTAGMTELVYQHLTAAKMKMCLRAYAPKRYADEVAFALENLDGVRELLAARGIAFRVGILPDEFQISEEVRKAALQVSGKPIEDYELDRPQRLVREHLSSRGVDSCDLLPDLRQAEIVRRVCYPRESHYNRFGNSVVAKVYFQEILEPWLRRRLAPK